MVGDRKQGERRHVYTLFRVEENVCKCKGGMVFYWTKRDTQFVVRTC